MFRIKKILSGVLAFVMAFSFSIPSFANESNNVHMAPTYMENENINPHKMTSNELNLYNSLIDEQVDLIIQEYNSDIDRAWLRKEVVSTLEGGFSILKEQDDDGDDRAGTWIPDIKIKNSIAAAGINVAIGIAIGGSVAGVDAYVRKIGVREARRLFSRTLTSRLKAWGLRSLAGVLPVAINFVFNVLDPGTAIANFLDRNDVYPGNGYINYIL